MLNGAPISLGIPSEPSDGDMFAVASVVDTLRSIDKSNAPHRFDVNEDGHVSPIDALNVIYQLNARKSGPIHQSLESAHLGPMQSSTVFDVNSDGQLSPLDALEVINDLNTWGSRDLPPLLSAEVVKVVVAEGDCATNKGVFADAGTDAVAITASIGSVDQAPGNHGVWTWILDRREVPTQDVFVVITAADSKGYSSEFTFQLDVPNVAPELGVSTPLLLLGEETTISNSGTINDPDSNVVSLTATIGQVQDHGDGTWTWMLDTPPVDLASREVTVTAEDAENASRSVTFALLPAQDVIKSHIDAPSGIAYVLLSEPEDTLSRLDPLHGWENMEGVVDFRLEEGELHIQRTDQSWETTRTQGNLPEVMGNSISDPPAADSQQTTRLAVYGVRGEYQTESYLNSLYQNTSGKAAARTLLDCVGKVVVNEFPDSTYGSGTLLRLGSNRFVLTADHVVAGASVDQVAFSLEIGGQPWSTTFDVRKIYAGNWFGGRDLALLELARPVEGVQGAELPDFSAALKEMQLLIVGYGRNDHSDVRTKNFGYTTVDDFRSGPESLEGGQVYQGPFVEYEFDRGEAAITPGDSGGPDIVPIQSVDSSGNVLWLPAIAAVHSWAQPSVDLDFDGEGDIVTYGDITASTLINRDVVTAIRRIVPVAPEPVLVLEQIRVLENGDSGIGGVGEWHATVQLNGLPNSFVEHFRDNETYVLGHTFHVGWTSLLHLAFHGYEDDDGLFSGGDDTIPRWDHVLHVPNRLVRPRAFNSPVVQGGGISYQLFFSIGIPADSPHKLIPGEKLFPGHSVDSPNGQYTLTFHEDGNLTHRHNPTGVTLWATGTAGSGADVAVLQHDGNFVLYAGSHALWATGTQGHSGAEFCLQDDGNLVVYHRNGTPVWDSGTWWASHIPADASCNLIPGQVLLPGQTLDSANGRFTLRLEASGNLNLYFNPTGVPIWSSGTFGGADTAAVFQGDGNFVLYDGGTAVWSANTHWQGATHLVLQDDGNLVVYRWDGTPLWDSQTWWAGNIPMDTSYNLIPGQQLLPSQRLTSQDGRFSLLLHDNGNLYLYDNRSGAVLWWGGQNGGADSSAVFQGDGNFVLYDGGRAVWSANTHCRRATYLVLQNDGNLVVYAWDGTPLWDSGTWWAG
jgi:hypothetical protein